MPTRLLREGILTSERVNQLNPAAEVFYRRLMSNVDDHGLFDARSSILRSSLYPLRLERVTESDCEQWLTDCINAYLILLYQVHGKPYLKMLDTKWQTRSQPKYDVPVNGCKQLKAPVYLDVVVDVVRSRLIEVVDVDVVVPVDNSTRINKALENLKTVLQKNSPNGKTLTS
jgi:hypothetical protein